MELIIREGTYYSQGDEDSFFDRLQKLKSVSAVRGAPDGLHVKLKRMPGNSDLRELAALLYRYGLDMRPLSALCDSRNVQWFRDPNTFWYQATFGKTGGKARRKALA